VVVNGGHGARRCNVSCGWVDLARLKPIRIAVLSAKSTLVTGRPRSNNVNVDEYVDDGYLL
jgi:hypothetical protein